MPRPESDPGLPGGKRLVAVFFGMTASGKSTLGQAFARDWGASYHNTDRVRKELAGLHPTDRCPDQIAGGIYSADFTEKTYQAMLDRARQDFAQGCEVVVLDGSYSRWQDRDHVRQVAKELGARSVFIFCTCSDAEVQRRLDVRARDPEAVSDGRWEVYQHQKATFAMLGSGEKGACITLNTEQDIEGMLTWLAAHPLLRAGRHGAQVIAPE